MFKPFIRACRLFSYVYNTFVISALQKLLLTNSNETALLHIGLKFTNDTL